MNKYILEACIVLFLVIIGIGFIGEINSSNEVEKEVSSFEDSVSNDKEISDGNLSDVKIEQEDTSNLISKVNAKLASFIVEGLNGALKVVVNAISSITN